MKQQTRQMPKLEFRAAISPNSFVEKDNTLEVVFTTGSEGERGVFFEEPFLESLSLEPGHVRLARMNQGAPVLDNHRAFGSVANVIGVVENARIESSKGIAKIRLSQKPELAGIVTDIKTGIIRNVSVGYNVYKYQDISERDDRGRIQVRRLRAVDWEPLEISFVPVGFDPGAQVRSEPQLHDVIIESEETMALNLVKDDDKKDQAQPAQTEPKLPVLDGDRVLQAERKRVADIKILCRNAQIGRETEDDYITKGLSLEMVRTSILEAMIEKSKQTQIRSDGQASVSDTHNPIAHFQRGAENYLLYRINNKHELDENAKRFRGYTLVELMKENISVRGIATKGLEKTEIITRGIHSTSDFPNLLANVGNKVLRDAYKQNMQTFAPFVKRITVPDFKEQTRVQLGELTDFKKKNEAGEYEEATISESAEKYSIASYGRIIIFTREMIINDDLNAFARVPIQLGQKASKLESKLFWEIITGNPNMSDGNALFSAAHANLAAGGDIGAISIATLSTARKAMMTQTGIDGEEIDIFPRYLVVPVALLTTAQQFLAANIRSTSTKAADVNPFAGGELGDMPIAERRLDKASTDAWYMFSSTDQVDIIEMATLEGESSPIIETAVSFETDGVKVKARYSVGAKALDWRGIYKNPGV